MLSRHTDIPIVIDGNKPLGNIIPFVKSCKPTPHPKSISLSLLKHPIYSKPMGCIAVHSANHSAALCGIVNHLKCHLALTNLWLVFSRMEWKYIQIHAHFVDYCKHGIEIHPNTCTFRRLLQTLGDSVHKGICLGNYSPYLPA